MGLKLEQLIDRCMDVASNKGLAKSNPITLRISEPLKDQNTLIVVSYDEPHELILPLNVTWIDADPASDDYKVSFKRTSKNPAEGFYNAWVEIQTYDEVFTPPQYYASEDQPVPVYDEESELGSLILSKLSKTGDTMTGPLNARRLESGENFDLDEMIPRSFLVSEMSRQTQGFYSLLNQFNKKLTTARSIGYQNQLDINELKEQISSSTGGSGGDASILKFIHAQEVLSNSWTIEHNLSNPNILYTIRTPDGKTIIPQEQYALAGSGDKISVITFAEPIVGTAVLVSL